MSIKEITTNRGPGFVGLFFLNRKILVASSPEAWGDQPQKTGWQLVALIFHPRTRQSLLGERHWTPMVFRCDVVSCSFCEVISPHLFLSIPQHLLGASHFPIPCTAPQGSFQQPGICKQELTRYFITKKDFFRDKERAAMQLVQPQ